MFTTIFLRLYFYLVVKFYTFAKTTLKKHKAMAKNKKTEIIYQGNALTESRYDFNRTEKNAIYCVIQRVRKLYIQDDVTGERSFTELRITIPESTLDKIADAKDKKRTRESLINLRKRDIDIFEEDGSWLNVGFINWSKYHSERKEYEVEVSSQIMPHLVRLASHYTSYDLTVAISLKSKWSQRFYELCCQYRNYKDGEFHKTIDLLRSMFMLEEKYPKLPDFKKKVINVAQKELKELYDKGECDVCFDYVQTGKADKAEFHFYVTSKATEKAKAEQRKYTQDMVTHISRSLTSLFPTDKKFINRTMEALIKDKEQVKPVFEKIYKVEQRYPKNEQAAVLRYVLNEDFNIK